MPRVDVLVPNYQYGRFLHRCVSSILEQGIDDLRILIIDNASTDDSVAIARAFAARDARIEVRARTVNLGMHASLNEGVDWAAGDYFTVLCSDDILPPGALPRAIRIMQAEPRLAFAYGAYDLMRGSEPPARTIQAAEPREAIQAAEPREAVQAAEPAWTIRTGRAFIEAACRKLVRTLAPLVRTPIQKRAGHYRPELRYTNDIEMLLRLACLGDVAYTQAVQAVQRVHEANLSNETWRDPLLLVRADLAIFDSFFGNEGKTLKRAAALHARARRSIGEQAYWTGMAHILRGERNTGLALLRLAFSLTPSATILPPLRHFTRIDKPMHRIATALSHALGARA